MVTKCKTGRGSDKHKKDCNMWKKGNECPNVGGVSIRSRTGAPFRKGCVVNDQSNQASTRPPPCLHPALRVRYARSPFVNSLLNKLKGHHASLVGCQAVEGTPELITADSSGVVKVIKSMHVNFIHPPRTDSQYFYNPYFYNP